MAVVRGKLEFQNVVIMHTKSKYGDWQDQAQQFRAFLVKNDIFTTGPVIVQWELQELGGRCEQHASEALSGV